MWKNPSESKSGERCNRAFIFLLIFSYQYNFFFGFFRQCNPTGLSSKKEFDNLLPVSLPQLIGPPVSKKILISIWAVSPETMGFTVTQFLIFFIPAFFTKINIPKSFDPKKIYFPKRRANLNLAKHSPKLM